MIEKLKNNSGSSVAIWLIIIALTLVLASSFLIDFSLLYSNSKKVKAAVNLASKAASLQIKEGAELAEGMFKIDENKAHETFIKILAHNLNLNETTLEPLENSVLKKKPIIKEFNVINNTPVQYSSSTLSNNFAVKNPSVFAVVEFDTVTIFLNGKFTVDKLASSQLSTIYE